MEYKKWSRHTSFDKATGCHLVIRVKSVAGERFPPRHSVQTGSGARTASCPVGIGAFPHGKIFRGVKMTTHLHLIQRS
jgi:hypothetical protein